MDYFVSIENRDSDLWKIELVIESFKLNNLSENLLVSLAQYDGGTKACFKSNISNHQRVFHHANIGRLKGNLFYNEIYSIIHALENNLLSVPFVWFKKTNILYRQPSNKEDVVFSLGKQITPEILKEKQIDINNFLPIGNCIVFNKINLDFFYEIIKWINYYKDNTWDKIGNFIIGLELLKSKVKIDCDPSLESNMAGNLDCCFIDFSQGLPPIFIPEMYSYTSPLILGENPIKTLANIAPTPAAHFLNTCASQCLERSQK